MQIELKAFYRPDKKTPIKKIFGTLHIALPEFGIELRGIVVRKTNKGFIFEVPSRHGMNGPEVIRYPIVEFLDRAKKKELYAELAKTANTFILAEAAKLDAIRPKARFKEYIDLKPKKPFRKPFVPRSS